MLGRFVCPTQRLSELLAYEDELFQTGEPMRFSALGRTGNNPDAFFDDLVLDITDIAAFEQKLHGRASVDALEFRLGGVLGFLSRFRLQRITNWRKRGVTPFGEMTWGADWRDSVKQVLGSLSGTLAFEFEGLLNPGQHCGFKLRCGGLHASSFPTPEQVAFAIVACRDEGVPLKFTAGLHHPIRHFDGGLQTHMHGFINVFVAGVLAHARRLEEGQVRAIIEEENPRNFVFDDAGLRWKDHHATTEEIVAARRNVVSFGSCSFDEPRDDLRTLGWLS
jgi:hypothetical protein